MRGYSIGYLERKNLATDAVRVMYNRGESDANDESKPTIGWLEQFSQSLPRTNIKKPAAIWDRAKKAIGALKEFAEECPTSLTTTLLI